MKNPKIMYIAMVLALTIMVAPIVSASATSFGNSLIKTDSEFSGDAVVNETINLKWSTGTDTYEWNHASVFNSTSGQKTQSILNIKQVNGSMTWSYQRNGVTIPFQTSQNQYLDNYSMVKPQHKLSYPMIPFMPGIQLI
jgi:hypothetical protein